MVSRCRALVKDDPIMEILEIRALLCAIIVARCAGIPLQRVASDSALSDLAQVNEDLAPGEDRSSNIKAPSPTDETDSFNSFVHSFNQETRSTNDFEHNNGETMPSIDDLNGEFASDLSQEDDEVRERFWFFDDKKPLKKKPSVASEIFHGELPNGHIQKPLDDFDNQPLLENHVEDSHHEKPGFVKPFIDKIKKPIKAVLNKPAEVAAHILNTKPHRPFVGAEILNVKPSLIDHIKKPIEHILNKPAEIVAEVLNKPHEYGSDESLHEKPSIVDLIRPTEALFKPDQEFTQTILHHGKPDIFTPLGYGIKKPINTILHDSAESPSESLNKPHDLPAEQEVSVKPGLRPIIDHIKKPIESLIHKPAAVISDFFNKPHTSTLPEHGNVFHQKPNSIIDGLKKPIESLLHVPSETTSNHHVVAHHLNQNPESNKPILDHAKKPIDAVFQKPVSLIKPENFDSVIHFPYSVESPKPWDFTVSLKPSDAVKPHIEETEEPFGALLDQLYTPTHQPLEPVDTYSPPTSSFYLGLQNFRPDFGFVKEPKPANEPVWSGNWSSTMRPIHSWYPRPSWSQSSHYGIPSASYVRQVDSDTRYPYESNLYGPYAFAYPFGSYGR